MLERRQREKNVKNALFGVLFRCFEQGVRREKWDFLGLMRVVVIISDCWEQLALDAGAEIWVVSRNVDPSYR